MARFYATFDGSTVAALEANVAGKRFLRLAMTGSGATLKQALLDQRDAIDAAIRPQLTAANNNGANGTVVPRDAMTRGGTNTTTGLYTHPQAVYNSDPQVRPNVDITVANSTPVAPANPLTIANSTLDAARAAVNNAVTAAGVYGQLGSNADKTMRALFIDALATYVAWDTFTPDDPGPAPFSITTSPPVPSGTGAFGVTFQWFKNHPTDIAEAESLWTISVAAISQLSGESPGTNGVGSLSGSGTTAAGVANTGSVNSPTGLTTGYRYRITCTVQFRYTASGVVGPLRQYIQDFDMHA